jgi:putative MATE family efflux protein
VPFFAPKKTLDKEEKREVNRRLFYLALPIVLQSMINHSLAITDTFMVGALGERSLAAVTLANTPLFILALIIFGIQSGSCILVSQYWGIQDKDAINRVLGVGFLFAGSISFLGALAMTLFPEEILSVTSNDRELVALAAQYARIASFSYFINSLSLIYTGAQRSMENPRIGMTVMIFSTVFNAFLNYLFIFGAWGAPEMGVRGAALATLLARCGELAVLAVFAAWTPNFRLKPRLLFHPGRVIFHDFIKFSAPIVMNEALWSIGVSVYPVIMGHMRGAAVGIAAFSITQSVERMMSAFYLGTGQAVGVIIGIRLGSGKKEGAYELAKYLIKAATIAGMVSGTVLAALSKWIFEPYMFPVFKASEEMSAMALTMLFIVSAAAPAKSFNFATIVGVLRCGGDILVSTAMEIISLFALALPLAAFVGLSLKWGAVGVVAVMSAEELWKIAGIQWRFRKKKWINDLTRSTA